MWADNETDIDLLGFDYLADELITVLCEPRLLPITVGVSGDWGSGKSSLLKMTAKTLRADEAKRSVVVEFSPWQFEGFEDVKTALMQAVMTALVPAVEADTTVRERSRTLLAKLVGRVNWFTVAGAVARAGIAAHAGVPIDPTAFIGLGYLKSKGDAEASEAAREPAYASVAEFRADFETLLEGLEDVDRLVVFIDDLDRCLPPTIIETFEAIRLFLHVKKTAYVVAADERIVRDAITRRFPSVSRDYPTLGGDYFEKLIQTRIVVPPLSTNDAQTYINLLLAEVSNLADAEIDALREAARKQRESAYLAVAMNEGIATEALGGTLPGDLAKALAIARQISPPLSRRLRGNPRQIKRFLNTIMLRHRAAQRRGVPLDVAVLAKMGVLEQVDLVAFETLFRWQAEGKGMAAPLAAIEQAAAGGEGEVTDEATRWLGTERLAEWVRLDPPLAREDLGPYFFFSRERLVQSMSEARLGPAMQQLLARLGDEVERTRKAAIAEFATLVADEKTVVFDRLMERAEGAPRGAAMKSAAEMAGTDPTLVSEFAQRLARIPPANMPQALVLGFGVQFKPMPQELANLLGGWAASDAPVAAAAKAALK